VPSEDLGEELDGRSGTTEEGVAVDGEDDDTSKIQDGGVLGCDGPTYTA
jgi:hypothetical protein